LGVNTRQCALPVVLAGGLDAANARAAIEAVRPYALDVSSGVEIEKGIKDTAKMAAFLDAVNEFEQHKFGQNEHDRKI